MNAPSGSASRTHVPDLRERRRQETRLEITRAALELFEQQGSVATTVDEIARHAGVSPSTFFRCFATKEEPILGTDREFEAELLAWLESAPPEEVDLAGIEALFERSLQRLMVSSDEVKVRLLRTRRLIASDDHLRAAVFAADAVARSRLTQSIAKKVGDIRSSSFPCLLAESAGIATRVAFDAWVERIEAGDDADLVEIYRTTRAEVRQIFVGR